MAEKITLLRTVKEEHGAANHELMYWYDISAAPIRDASNTAIATQTENDLPTNAGRYVTAADRTALNTGLALVERVVRHQTAGEAGSVFLARLLADHTARMAWFVQRQRDIYALAGTARSA